MHEYMGFLHIWSQIVLHYAFIDACVLVTDMSAGKGEGSDRIIQFCLFCQELALIRSCFCLDLVAMGLVHF